MRPYAAAIAWRYLRSRKGLDAVGVITAVSVCGVAVATAALVCILSVFNGFEGILTNEMTALTPDIVVTPAKGKVIANADSLAAVLQKMPGVSAAMPVVQENALALYDDREYPIVVKGVDPALYHNVAGIRSAMTPHGTYSISYGDDIYADPYADETASDSVILPDALLSIGVSSALQAWPEAGGDVTIFSPRRIGAIDPSNPATAFITQSFTPAGTFQSNRTEIDANTVIVDLTRARELFQYDAEGTAVEASLDSISPARIDDIAKALGSDYRVADRLMQHEVSYRMIAIEKWVTFLLLAFILVIASFNIISSLSMLVLEKKDSMRTLISLGATRRSIGSIFAWESVYVMLIGSVAGMIIGVILCLIQQHYGLITLNADTENLLVTAYPVELRLSDLVIVAVPLAIIGTISALISSAYARSILIKRTR